MKGPGFRRRFPAVIGAVAAATALGIAAFVVAAATAGVSKKEDAPLIRIQGNSFNNITAPVGGQVAFQVQFSMNAQRNDDGYASGWFEFQSYDIAQDGTPTQTSYTNVKVACLSADKATGTVWFSGLVTAGNDLRLPVEQQQQEQSIIAARKLITFGRFRDTNGDGSVDERSVFITQATTAYPNALLSSGDNGTISTPWFISGNATSAATGCLLRNNAFQTADYQVVDGPTNQVQWLQPDDVTPVGSPVTGTATNMSHPPAQSVYNLASATRALLSQTLYLKLN